MQFMFHGLSSEEKKILKIISNGNDFRYKQLLDDTPERIERIIKSYYYRLPVIKDLNQHGINVKDLSELHPSRISDDIYIKAIPILVNWLKKNDSNNDAKLIIVSVLTENPLSKQYAFDTILELFKTIDPDEKDEYGYPSLLPMYLGNGLLRWVDDSYADIIFSFLKDKRLKKNNFLISSLANLKNPVNIQKAKDFVLQELKTTPDKNQLVAIFVVLYKFKVIEAEEIVEPYIKDKDSDIRNGAKKLMHLFEKIHQSKN